MSVNGQFELPIGGQQNYPLVASYSARLRPGVLPTHWWVLAAGSGLGVGLDSVASEGLGQPDGFAGGLADVGVVE